MNIQARPHTPTGVIYCPARPYSHTTVSLAHAGIYKLENIRSWMQQPRRRLPGLCAGTAFVELGPLPSFHTEPGVRSPCAGAGARDGAPSVGSPDRGARDGIGVLGLPEGGRGVGGGPQEKQANPEASHAGEGRAYASTYSFVHVNAYAPHVRSVCSGITLETRACAVPCSAIPSQGSVAACAVSLVGGILRMTIQRAHASACMAVQNHRGE